MTFTSPRLSPSWALLLASAESATTAAGYPAALPWVRGFGELRRAGVEGTGSYGAALTRTCATTTSPSWRSTDPTAPPDAAAAKPTSPTLFLPKTSSALMGTCARVWNCVSPDQGVRHR